MKNLKNIETKLNSLFVEREEIIRTAIITLIARQHFLMIGSPGTAKSAVIQKLAESVMGSNYFWWLLTKFSTPEEIFGPVLLSKLEQGIYERNVAHKLPEANIAFLDEIFKANSAILNALLTLINERVYHNNGTPIQVPLLSLFGASNEYPDEDEGLGALYDRFLVRFEVSPIVETKNFEKMLGNVVNPQSIPQGAITLADLQAIQNLADQVVVPHDVIEAMSAIKEELMSENIRPTDRRWVESLKVIKANACYKNKQVADVGDLDVLKHILWLRPEDRKLVFEKVTKHTVDQFTSQLEAYRKEIEEAAKVALDIAASGDSMAATNAGQEAAIKIKSINSDLSVMLQKYPDKEQQINGYITIGNEKLRAVYRDCLGLNI